MLQRPIKIPSADKTLSALSSKNLRKLVPFHQRVIPQTTTFFQKPIIPLAKAAHSSLTY